MPLTVSQVLGSRPEALSTAAGGVDSAASSVDEQVARGRAIMTTLATQWMGSSADRAQGGADEMIGDQVIYRDKLKSLQAELNESAANLTNLRKEVSDLVSSSEAAFFDIADDGSVRPGLRLLWWASLWPTNALKVKIRQLTLQTKIQTALAKFDAADKAAAAALRKIDRG